ncbi:helix-turn-helix transcriptional regulator [Faecalibacterium duncaniae]|uniref:helix-turn-helix domain-containing protein n=1 Tax=Faecalibacterium duncaniae (strain DSM 17677 / JCM 31915 / A2-165) TaxID=411483 RepID=UPI0029416BDA|nr:helix-turn-helix transcriptional regulator [Faecalibacterium duncaniae]MDV5093373.1 helix-turn-helix transcriptional regulator [Faecalibacterium duncaniae]
MNTRIKFLRKNSGLTQEKFAERIGLKQNSIALIESGKRNISDQAILSICREFGVREEWLRTGEGEMYAPAPTTGLDLLVQEKSLRREERILIEKFVNLKPETRQQILNYIQEVAAALSSGDAPSEGQPIDCEKSAESLHAELDRQLGIEKKEVAGESEAS